MPVPAVMNFGMPTVRAGSQIVTFGISAGWKMIFFLWVWLFVSTPARPTSDPVPAVVGTAMIGAILRASARVCQSSISSRSQTLSFGFCRAISAIILPRSKAEPPPKQITPSWPPAW